MIVVTKRGMNELKYGENNENMKKLQEARLYVTLDHWRTERSKVVGFLASVHPIYMWKPDLKRQINAVLMEIEVQGFVKSNWEKKNPELKESIQEFVLVHEKKAFGEGRVRVQTTVINIEARLEDAEYLKQLLVEATKGRKIVRNNC